MKKILLAFDGSNASEGAFEFARRLNELSPILLTGVFLPQAELANLWSYADGVGSPLMIPLVEPGESELIKENIEHFEERCKHSGIEYRVHKDFFDLALPELKKESRYADLLILGSEIFYENIHAGSPNDYLEDALEDVKCPVILVPEKFDFPENIILAYDGSEESVFAIKQFAYLFPELTKKETLLVYISNEAEEDFPDKIQIEELAARHFNNLTMSKLDIPKKHFSTWASEKRSAIVVSGSYGRHGLSQLFKKSFVNDLIAEHWLPVFIAHK
ncbi:universal stress protein [Panacibacter ginsenosidivorans]|uniref:Universal stress protein n=1 Tax=Panacibacter ginsenosidivorans TaxID=1813871 RepID=A0A5B8V356_9BACT|nr:universal stress protein [Panacibacter ginsenosidivorans]QEC65794.1 universal stress protein [Panacibacter ginsenosidivorans]